VGRSVKAAVESAGCTPRVRFFDALYRQYASPLLRFISRQNVSHEEAREIVQETYCRLQQVPQIETLESPRGYLFRTAINLARDSKRQRRREYQVGDMGEAGASTVGEVPSEAPTAYQVLKGEQELAIIRQAIAELSPTCRRVFIMHRFGSATYAQIAESLGLSVSMIEKHVSQALAHLKTRLDTANSDVQSRKAGT
jgi:RNA polymerase sigma factor (sigma-70 family)